MKIKKKQIKSYKNIKIFNQKDNNYNKKYNIFNLLLDLYDLLSNIIYFLFCLFIYQFYYNRINHQSSPQMTKRPRPQQLSQQLEQDLQKVQKQNKPTKQLPTVFHPKNNNFYHCIPLQENDLPLTFFRQEVVDLAQKLIGKIFVRKTDKGIIKAIIVQTQAYKAPLDKGCHAYNNKKTQRTKYFWLDGGHLYIYTIYMPSNVCLNIVAGNVNQPEAVLIRAVQPIEGIDLVKQFRNIKSPKIEDLCNGPGKVGQALGVNMSLMNGINLVNGKQLKIIDGGLQNFTIGVSKRINIDYADQWKDKPWRFFIEGNTFVSKVPSLKPQKSTNKSKTKTK